MTDLIIINFMNFHLNIILKVELNCTGFTIKKLHNNCITIVEQLNN